MPGGPGQGAVSFNSGTGVVNLKYIPAGHPSGGAKQSGTVIVTIEGLANLSGVTQRAVQGDQLGPDGLAARDAGKEKWPDASARP